ncbi:MAG: hypothetical protein AMXMBFR22_12630 [Phycisphaerae bacterium]
MRRGQQTDADDVHVFLKGGVHRRFAGLPQPGVNDVHPRVAEGPGKDFHAAVMPVQTDLGEENPRWMMQVV